MQHVYCVTGVLLVRLMIFRLLGIKEAMSDTSSVGLRRNYFAGVFLEAKNDFRLVFRLANKLLFRTRDDGLPRTEDTQSQADRFNKFFVDKIQKIRDGIDGRDVALDTRKLHLESTYLTHWRHEHFKPLSDEDVVKLIRRSATKSCSLDPCPTQILKDNQGIFVPWI